MNLACEGCGLVMNQRYLTGGLCLGCAWNLEALVEPTVHRVHRERDCIACGHPSIGELCPRCDDFVST